MVEMLPVHPVLLETVAMSLPAVGPGLSCRVRRVPLPHGFEPLAVVRRTVGVPEEAVSGTLFHGTSWRHDSGAVVLTWAVGPDPDPEGEGLRFLLDGGARLPHGRLDDPTPVPVELRQVVEHAVAHVSWLLRQRPEMFAAAAQPELWRRVAELEPTRAGML